jgi:hypothetical protein
MKQIYAHMVMNAVFTSFALRLFQVAVSARNGSGMVASAVVVIMLVVTFPEYLKQKLSKGS